MSSVRKAKLHRLTTAEPLEGVMQVELSQSQRSELRMLRRIIAASAPSMPVAAAVSLLDGLFTQAFIEVFRYGSYDLPCQLGTLYLLRKTRGRPKRNSTPEVAVSFREGSTIVKALRRKTTQYRPPVNHAVVQQIRDALKETE